MKQLLERALSYTDNEYTNNKIEEVFQIFTCLIPVATLKYIESLTDYNIFKLFDALWYDIDEFQKFYRSNEIESFFIADYNFYLYRKVTDLGTHPTFYTINDEINIVFDEYQRLDSEIEYKGLTIPLSEFTEYEYYHDALVEMINFYIK